MSYPGEGHYIIDKTYYKMVRFMNGLIIPITPALFISNIGSCSTETMLAGRHIAYKLITTATTTQARQIENQANIEKEHYISKA